MVGSRCSLKPTIGLGERPKPRRGCLPVASATALARQVRPSVRTVTAPSPGSTPVARVQRTTSAPARAAVPSSASSSLNRERPMAANGSRVVTCRSPLTRRKRVIAVAPRACGSSPSEQSTTWASCSGTRRTRRGRDHASVRARRRGDRCGQVRERTPRRQALRQRQ